MCCHMFCILLIEENVIWWNLIEIYTYYILISLNFVPKCQLTASQHQFITQTNDDHIYWYIYIYIYVYGLRQDCAKSLLHYFYWIFVNWSWHKTFEEMYDLGLCLKHSLPKNRQSTTAYLITGSLTHLSFSSVAARLQTIISMAFFGILTYFEEPPTEYVCLISCL